MKLATNTTLLLILLLTAFAGLGIAQKKQRITGTVAPPPPIPKWEWVKIAEDEKGKPYYIDKSKIFRLEETVTYSTKWERNGVDVVFVAVSNCLRGTMTGIPAFTIDKDGEVTRLSQAPETIESTNGKPLEEGSVYHQLLVYACKNGKKME